MGKIVNFEETKQVILSFVGSLESKVNLGIGDDPDEFALLLDGYRVQMLQLSDDDLYELATIYNQVKTWLTLGELDEIGLAYRRISLSGPFGNGIVVGLDQRTGKTVEFLQLVFQAGQMTISVESKLLSDLDLVLQWFWLNAVLN